MTSLGATVLGMPSDDIRSLLEARIEDAESDLLKLRAALKAIDAGETTPASRPRAKAPKPEVKVVPAGKLLKTIEESPGTTTTTLARMTGGDQSSILALLKEAEAGGIVRREGQRRATSWFLITDEDRVAARAAEIAANSKPDRAREPSGTGKPKKRTPAEFAKASAQASPKAMEKLAAQSG